MADTFDFIIVGKGMMGAAAARHLAATGATIALIGPDEPVEWPNHAGVFSSHYDNGRITRTIDPDADWARLAQRSIARYGEIASQGGTEFYSETGCLIAASSQSLDGGYLNQVSAARDRLGVAAPLLSEDDMKRQFGFFQFPQGYSGIFEATGAGHIDPRALVKAQVAAAAASGVRVISQEVVGVSETADGVVVSTLDGATFRAARVLVAAGGFSIAKALLPRAIDLTVKARTVFFAEVGEEQVEAFAGMPSLIEAGDRQDASYYMLPPILYPDGRFYIKIGGDPVDTVLPDEPSVRAWFRSGGDPVAASHLQSLLARAVPSLVPRSVRWRPCVTSFTRHGYPYIGFVGSERIAVLTGGNGTAAKSSDEIGRLGSVLLETGALDAPEYATDFAPCYS